MKAANILITKQGILKLADFGLARAYSVGKFGGREGEEGGGYAGGVDAQACGRLLILLSPNRASSNCLTLGWPESSVSVSLGGEEGGRHTGGVDSLACRRLPIFLSPNRASSNWPTLGWRGPTVSVSLGRTRRRYREYSVGDDAQACGRLPIFLSPCRASSN